MGAKEIENKKMAQKPTYRIGDPINAGTFRKYIEHFYNGILRNAGNIIGDGRGAIERLTFVAVAHSLLATGDFKTGEKFRLSQVAIAEKAGASTKSVRRVLNLLEVLGAIRVVEMSKRPGGGKPVKVYTLTYSQNVHEVLKDKDANKLRERWKRDERHAVEESNVPHNPNAMGTTTPFNVPHNPIQWEPQPHNRNFQEQERNDSDESSPAPVVAPPAARDGAASVDEEDLSWVDEFLRNLTDGI